MGGFSSSAFSSSAFSIASFWLAETTPAPERYYPSTAQDLSGGYSPPGRLIKKRRRGKRDELLFLNP